MALEMEMQQQEASSSEGLKNDWDGMCSSRPAGERRQKRWCMAGECWVKSCWALRTDRHDYAARLPGACGSCGGREEVEMLEIGEFLGRAGTHHHHHQIADPRGCRDGLCKLIGPVKIDALLGAREVGDVQLQLRVSSRAPCPGRACPVYLDSSSMERCEEKMVRRYETVDTVLQCYRGRQAMFNGEVALRSPPNLRLRRGHVLLICYAPSCLDTAGRLVLRKSRLQHPCSQHPSGKCGPHLVCPQSPNHSS